MSTTVSRMSGYDKGGGAIFEEVKVSATSYEFLREEMKPILAAMFPDPEIICDVCGKVSQGSPFFEVTQMAPSGDPLHSRKACSAMCARQALTRKVLKTALAR